MTTAEKMKNMLTWGFILWLVGYLAGIVLFFIVPKDYIGWILSPFATIFTIWVLMKRIKHPELMYYFGTGLIWMIMAIVLDFIFIVILLKTGASYYQPDVFVYYLLTLALPVLVGFWKYKHKAPDAQLF